MILIELDDFALRQLDPLGAFDHLVDLKPVIIAGADIAFDPRAFQLGIGVIHPALDGIENLDQEDLIRAAGSA